MKIVIASSGLGHITRGVEAWAEDLGRALADNGSHVLLCKGGGIPEAPYEQVLPCWQRLAPRTQRLARWTRRGLWRFYLGSTYQIEEATFSWHLLKLLRREAIDILHVQDPHIALIVQRAQELGWVSTRTILGNGTQEPYDFLRKITYLQHLSPFHLQTTKEAGCWKPTWTAIPNFIDTRTMHPGRSDSLRAELGIPAKALVLMTAAAIKRHHKRVDHLVEEFGLLRRRRPDLPVWLVVAGGREQETDELIETSRRSLGDRVRFLIQFPRSRMPELYRLADVFVLCSLQEMGPIALLEATASGLPCVIHKYPNMIWEAGPGGEVIDMTVPGELASTLDRLLNSPEHRQRLGHLGRRYCEEIFSQSRVLGQILAYYDYVASYKPNSVASSENAEGVSLCQHAERN